MSDRPNQFTDTKCVYLLCPDAKCNGFTEPGFTCLHHCPRAKEMQKAVVCWKCAKVVKVPSDYGSFARIDCECGASVFTLMSSVYRRVNV